MVDPLGWVSIDTGSLLALLVAAAIGGYAVRQLDGATLGATLRARFLLGVPWGSAIVIGGLIVVYVGLQTAGGSISDPLVVPFRAWSYHYPLGLLTAAFTHGDLGHLTGNLLSTAVFAPVAEYAWSHYPTERGRQSFSSLGTNPYVRIGLFVLGVLLFGLATSLFVPGPIIGFSGVIFGFAGFALVTMPVLAIFAIVAEGVVRLLYAAIRDPVVTAEAGTRFVEPWWAEIAVQGHAFGLLVGILLGVAIGRRRTTLPSARVVWFGTLVFAIAEALYAIYWYQGANRFVLYRAAGAAAVIVLATLVAGTVAGSDRPILSRLEIPRWQVAGGLLLAVVLAIGLAAVPYNLADVDGSTHDDGISVRDYTVVYGENVPNGYAQAVTIPVIGTPLTDRAKASGVIVTSDRRNAWEQVVPASQLAFEGRKTVAVGGLGWREHVIANRTAWNGVDTGTTYKVFLRRPDEERRLAFVSDPVELAPRIAGLNFSIEPRERGYLLNATRNDTLAYRVGVPPPNASVRIGPVSAVRRGHDLYITHEGTKVRVADFRLRTRPEE